MGGGERGEAPSPSQAHSRPDARERNCRPHFYRHMVTSVESHPNRKHGGGGSAAKTLACPLLWDSAASQLLVLMPVFSSVNWDPSRTHAAGRHTAVGTGHREGLILYTQWAEPGQPRRGLLLAESWELGVAAGAPGCSAVGAAAVQDRLGGCGCREQSPTVPETARSSELRGVENPLGDPVPWFPRFPALGGPPACESAPRSLAVTHRPPLGFPGKAARAESHHPPNLPRRPSETLWELRHHAGCRRPGQGVGRCPEAGPGRRLHP